MSYYQKLFNVYERARTWSTFLEQVSEGTGKYILLQALEEGWRARILSDLCERYRVPTEEADVLLSRYDCLVKAKPIHASVQELAVQLGKTVQMANVLRGYFRYAYYVAVDDSDTIFTTLDELLTNLGAGTPTRDECAKSYTTVTGQPINPDAVVLTAETADGIADHLAAETEDMQRRLTQALETSPTRAAELATELENLNSLHVALTGKSVVDMETVRETQEYLACLTPTSSKKDD